MKQILPLLFLFIVFLFPQAIHSVSFTISNPVREGDYFIIDASLSGISSSAAYIQGMFTNINNPDYFGFTWGQNEDWISYQSSPSKEFISSKFPVLLRDNLQKIWVKPDYGNSGFKGSGDYFLKLRRYTGSSDSSAGESNDLTIYLLAPTAEPTDTPTPTSSPTPSPTQEPTITLNPTKTPTPKPPTPTTTPKSSIMTTPTSSLQTKTAAQLSTSAAILGDSTTSAVIARNLDLGSDDAAIPDSKTQKQLINNSVIYKYTFIFGVIVSAISGGWLYFRHKTD